MTFHVVTKWKKLLQGDCDNIICVLGFSHDVGASSQPDCAESGIFFIPVAQRNAKEKQDTLLNSSQLVFHQTALFMGILILLMKWSGPVGTGPDNDS